MTNTVEIAGHTLELRFSDEAVREVEEKYGALTGPTMTSLYEHLVGIPFSVVYWLMALALRHERIDDEAVTEYWLLDHADSRMTWLYAEHVLAALAEARPGVDALQARLNNRMWSGGLPAHAYEGPP